MLLLEAGVEIREMEGAVLRQRHPDEIALDPLVDEPFQQFLDQIVPVIAAEHAVGIIDASAARQNDVESDLQGVFPDIRRRILRCPSP